MTRLYLMRHGETVDNVRQLMQGQTQGQLTDEGRRQALRAGEELAPVHLDAIVSSDLKRSFDTACIVAAPLGLTVSTTPLLRERDWGDFTGRYIPDLKGLPFPDNVEQMEQLLNRARRFLHYIYEEYPSQTVLAVGHGIINKAVQAVFHNCQTRDIARMENAEVRLLLLEHDFTVPTGAEMTDSKNLHT